MGRTAPKILLAACAVWLVMQNTVLAAALVWREVPGVATAGTAVWKAALANGFAHGWMTAIAIALVLGLLVAASTSRLERKEARHG